MRAWVIYLTLIAVLALAIFEAFNQQVDKDFYDDMRSHHAKAEIAFSLLLDNWVFVREFIGVGERNTAAQGADLCERINRLEEMNQVEPSDCQQLYFGE